MRYAWKRRLRSPVPSLLLLLLAAAGSLLLCYGLAYKTYVDDNLADMDNYYTTIAYPNYSGYTSDIWSITGNGREHWAYVADISVRLRHFANESSYLEADTRRFLRAALQNASPILSADMVGVYSDQRLDPPRNKAVFAATCEEVRLLTPEEEKAQGKQYTELAYEARMRVDEVLLLHGGYEEPEEFLIYNTVFTKTGEAPYVPGETYLVYGDYRDIPRYDPSQPLADMFKTETYNRRVVNVPLAIWFDIEAYEHTLTVQGAEYAVRGVDDDFLSRFIQPYLGDVRRHIDESADFAYWYEAAQIDVRSAYILTTSRLGSIVWFNRGTAYIVQGRGFTPEETKKGAAVCLVHERFAALNGLSAGDTLELEASAMNTLSGAVPYPLLDSGSYLNEAHSMTVTIVGVYNAPSSVRNGYYDAYGLSANYIIIPDSAIPELTDSVVAAPILPDEVVPEGMTFREYMDSLDATELSALTRSLNALHVLPQYFSILIPGGRLDDFITDAEGAGLLDYFSYGDQGYSTVAASAERLGETAGILLYLALGVWGVFFAVLMLLALRNQQELGMLLSLGMKRGAIVRQYLAGWLLLLMPALLLSGLAVTFSFDAISDGVMQSVLSGELFNGLYSAGTVGGYSPGQAESLSQELLGNFTARPTARTVWLTTAAQLGLYTAALLLLGTVTVRQDLLRLLRRRD